MTLDHLLLVAFALLAGLSRGFSGFGAALIFMPLAASLIGPRLAAGVLMVIDIVFALPLGLRAFKQVKPVGTLLMLLGSAVTIPLGTWILIQLDAVTLRWGICALVVAMLGIIASGWRYGGEPRAWITVMVGALSGLFSGIAQIGGPPVVAYYMGRKDATATQVRASIFLFFAGSSVIGLVSYLYAGILVREVLWLSLWAGPAYGTGIFVGSRMFRVASEVFFRRVALLTIAAGVVISLPVWG